MAKRDGQLTASSLAVVAAFAALAFLLAAGQAHAAPGPVDPEQIAQAKRIDQGRPYVSPTGEQIIVWKVQDGGDRPLAARSRGGGSFGPAQELSVTGNAQLPEMVFNQQGKGYAIWPIRTTSVNAESAIRPPGGPFSSVRSTGSCHFGLSVAVSNQGKLALACSSYRTAALHYQAAYGVADEIRAVRPSVYPLAPVDDPYMDTAAAWGADGTLAVAVIQEPTSTSEEIRLLTQSPSGSGMPATVVADETDPRWLNFGGLAVFPNGTAALAFASGNATVADPATLQLHPPAGLHTSVALPGDGVGKLTVDRAGKLHLLVWTGSGPSSSYMSVTADAAGVLSPPIPIPTPIPGAYLSEFLVADDGTEAALFVDLSGSVFVVRRPAGAGAFEPAVQVAGPDAQQASASLTPTGDVLVVWTREAGPDDDRVLVGGLDSGARPALGPLTIPDRVLVNEPIRLFAQASDSMGIRSINWKIDGAAVSGGVEASHTFKAAGLHTVEVTATDRAGNVTSRTAGVQAVAPRGADRRPTVDRRPARMRIRGKNRIKFRALRRRGNRYAVRTNEPVRVLAQLIARPRTARSVRPRTVRRRHIQTDALRQRHARLRAAPSSSARTSAVGDLILAERRFRVPAGRRAVRLRPKAKLLGRRARTMRLRVRFTATDRGGNRTVVNRRLRVRR